MTLVTRVSLFFLSTLALVLLGFSLTLYAIAGNYLNRQMTDRVESTLKRLAAVAEVENDRIEWEPNNRAMHLEVGDPTAEVAWRVIDGSGRTIDRSDSSKAPPSWPALAASAANGVAATLDSSDGQWRFASLQIAARGALPRPQQDDPSPGNAPARAVVIETAIPLAPMRALLSQLAWLSGILSLALWLLAAVAGRAICRRALSPLTAMASDARDMKADVLSQRLPEPKTCDECEDLARAFNELLARVEETFERQREFSGNASHQLRTPLAAILGQIEVVLRRERPADEYRRVLEVIQRRADDLRQMVDMLLFLARADGESLLPDLETVDLGQWLPEYFGQWAGDPRANDLRLELTATDCQARVHRPLLGQLLDNLLDNACKHSSPGTPIVVRMTKRADGLRLQVEGQGDGIEPSDLPHIFEPFYRSRHAAAPSRSGTGLGLAVAQQIAAALGGRIEVKSQPGVGSRFQLVLPSAGAMAADPFVGHGQRSGTHPVSMMAR